jgi:hypothetical protein
LCILFILFEEFSLPLVLCDPAEAFALVIEDSAAKGETSRLAHLPFDLAMILAVMFEVDLFGFFDDQWVTHYLRF